jgi:hypothetical protein
MPSFRASRQSAALQSTRVSPGRDLRFNATGDLKHQPAGWCGRVDRLSVGVSLQRRKNAKC